MLRSSEPDRIRVGTSLGEGEIPRTAELAAIGLTTRLVLPARMHAINGHLHNATMLADLLSRQGQQTGLDGKGNVALQRRAGAIASELEALDRQLKLLQALIAFPVTARYARCNAQPALLDAQSILRAEAMRLSARLWVHPLAVPCWIASSDAAFVQAVVVCATAALRQVSAGSTISVLARIDENALQVAIAMPSTAGEAALDDPVEPDLLAELVSAAGGQLDLGPPLILSFPRARSGVADGDD